MEFRGPHRLTGASVSGIYEPIGARGSGTKSLTEILGGIMPDYELTIEHETETEKRVEMVRRILERKRIEKARTVTRRSARYAKWIDQGRV